MISIAFGDGIFSIPFRKRINDGGKGKMEIRNFIFTHNFAVPLEKTKLKTKTMWLIENANWLIKSI